MTGEELRKRRVALGMSQEDLSEAIGTTQATISLWERGKHKIQHEKMLDLALKYLEETQKTSR